MKGVVSFIGPQFEDCQFFYSHLGNLVHMHAAKTPETNIVSGEWLVLFQPTTNC